MYEESTGLYYAKARYYDAGIGRFVSEDSYKGEQKDLLSFNLYAYVRNNPVKYTDPSGNIALADDAIIALLCVVGGVSYYIYVNAAYLRTPEGKEKLNNVTEVICDGITYTVKKFKQKFSRELEWEAIAPPSVKLADAVKKVDTKSTKPKVKQGKSRAPATGEPGTTYEQLDDKGKVVSRTKYGKNKKPEYRQDFDGKPHYSKKEGKYLNPHQHNYKYNDQGQPIGETVTEVK